MPLTAKETRRLQRTMELERRKNADDSLFSSMISESFVYEDFDMEEVDQCKQDSASCLPTHIEPVITIAECRLCDTLCSEDYQMDDLYGVDHDG